jgi:hypothetical protein
MELVDQYSSRLEQLTGGDAGDSYAIALDAFIRGNINSRTNSDPHLLRHC